MIRFILLFFIITLHCGISLGQSAFSAKKLSAAELKQVSSKIKFRGQLKEGWTWKDKLGENLLVLTRVSLYTTTSVEYGDLRNAELGALQFIKSDTAYRLLWRLNDFIKECEFDVTCNFFKNGTSVTDLDSDGIAETTVLYKLSCKSDVSPDAMKLIMHEDTVKYALRGQMCDPGNDIHQENCPSDKLDLSKLSKPKEELEQYIQAFGRYENEKDFEKAPASFIVYARSQWIRFVKMFDY